MIRRALHLLRAKPPESLLPPVYITYVAHRRTWVLLDAYRVSVPVPGAPADWRIHFQIREGFEFDLASIPRPLWWWIAPFELSIAAPLIHDYFYAYRGRPEMHVVEMDDGLIGPARVLERKTADRIFYDLMRLEGIAPLRARVAYLAVRWFGPRWLPSKPRSPFLRVE